jgi:hypothetical protein
MISLVFAAPGSPISNPANYDLNNSAGGLEGSESGEGGLFSIGVSFARFFGFVLFGIGLPSDTPALVNWIFIIWETCISIFTAGWIINSIWGG